MKRTYVLAAAAATAAAAVGIAYYVAPPAGPKLPSVPAIPPEWTDPPVIELVEQKRRAVEADPRNGAAWGELGMAFDVHLKHPEAITCYRTAMALDPGNARWAYLLARVVRLDDPEEAVRLLRSSLDLQPPTPAHRTAIRLTLADLLSELGQGAEADEHLPGGLRRRAGEPVGQVPRRGGRRRSGRHGRRRPHAHDPGPQPVRAEEGGHRLVRHPPAGRPVEGGRRVRVRRIPTTGRPVLGEPVHRGPRHAGRGQKILVETITSHEAVSNYPAAVETARRLADMYPTPRSQLLLGRALGYTGDYDAAIPVLEDAIHGDPNLVMAHAFLGVARFELAERAHAAGQRAVADSYYHKAVAALDKAVELKPDYAPGYFYRARAMMRLNRPDDALLAIRACIDRRPEEWEGYVVLGEMLSAAGKKAEAITALEQAVKLANPNEVRPRQVLEKLSR